MFDFETEADRLKKENDAQAALVKQRDNERDHVISKLCLDIDNYKNGHNLSFDIKREENHVTLISGKKCLDILIRDATSFDASERVGGVPNNSGVECMRADSQELTRTILKWINKL